MRRALRENGNRTAADQHGPGRLEGFRILLQIRAGILAAVHGDRLERSRDRANNRHVEQRSLGEEGHAPRRKTQEKCRVNQPVWMVEHKDHGTRLRHALRSAHLGPPEEDPQHATQQQTEQRSHVVWGCVVRDRRQAAYVQITPPNSTATGMINTASANERASDIIPTIDGEGTSPRI